LPLAPTISIIDDDVFARAGIRDFVASLGYRTLTFPSVDEFVNSGRVEETSCVISDVQMPGLSGLDLQEYLAGRGHGTPIIFLTAYPDERSRARALGAGALGFLVKPFDDKSLIQCLNAAVGSSN
jgi:FixJ family two-component response regulator